MSDIALPACIATALADLDKERARLLLMDRAARDAEAVADQLRPTITRRYEWDDPVRVQASAGIGTFQSVILCVRTKIASDIVPVLRALRQRGYKMAGKPEDEPEIARRVYKIVAEGGHQIVVQLYLEREEDGAEGAGCRYVVVGHEQKPVYELRCDGAAIGDVEAAS